MSAMDAGNPMFWQEEARRYAGNADYWRDRSGTAEAEVSRLRQELAEARASASRRDDVAVRAVRAAEARIAEIEAERGDWKAGCERALRDREAVEAEMDTRLAAAWSDRDALAARLERAGPDALRSAAAELQAMTLDPFALLTEAVGIRGPIAVALWLRDRAADTHQAAPTTSERAT